MARFTQLKRNLEQIFFPNRDQHAIPIMDGRFTPNDLLEGFTDIGPVTADMSGICAGPDGALYMSAGRSIYRLSGPGKDQRQVCATFDDLVSAVAVHPDGRLLACVSGKGLAAIGAEGQLNWLTTVNGAALQCLTAVAVAADGTIFVADGSRQNRPENWKQDLMEKSQSGRLIACNAMLDAAKVLLDGLAYPNGLVVSDDGKWLWFSESWAHRLCRLPLPGAAVGGVEIVHNNLPAYPAGLCLSRKGGYWLAFFAVRTHLTEFILREDEYRHAMMKTIPVAHWPGPALTTTGHCLEPMQMGNVKALGIEKPWAPARSYGLVVHLDRDGQVTESLHSRRAGKNHGITAACDTEDGFFVVSKGRGQLLCERQEGTL